jgi:methylmalonyl-CoA mutase cobalamin-binding subunit
MSEQIVKLVVRQEATDPYEHALNGLRDALGDQARLSGPDDAGVIEVSVDAGDEDDAIKRVIDAMAAAGADDHFEIAEHPS